MSTFGTPYEGRDNIIAAAVYTGLSMGLYTNTLNSLDASTVLADITEPTGTGYARVTMSSTWASTNGVVVYDGTNPQFENTGGTDWTGDVTGAFLTDGVYVLHFKDLAAGATTVTPSDIIEVDPSTVVA
jgi:hypothetical protein